jgi:hypothetical protein
MKQQLIETIKKALLTKKCDCGAPMLNESKQYTYPITEAMRYHLDNNIQIHDNIFRPGSEAHIELIAETRVLWEKEIITLQDTDKRLFENTDLGRFGLYEGQKVPLDLPIMEMVNEEELEEEKKQPALGKPKRGGSKKFYVYVKDPKTKRIKKVSFGMAGGGLRAKLNNSKARAAFSKRHNCPQKKDRTKASYWSCRLPRYAKLLGFKTTFSGYW